MKSKALVILSTIVMALALIAQNTTQTPPAANSDNAKNCACCNHDQADGRNACCGKDAACCGKRDACCKGGSCCRGKDGKACPMMSKDHAGNVTCCGGDKCSMTSTGKAGKSCCGGKMCERPQPAA
jgi:hypothetical protein